MHRGAALQHLFIRRYYSVSDADTLDAHGRHADFARWQRDPYCRGVQHMTVTTTRWSYHDTAASYALTMLIFLTSIGFSSFSQADEMLHWRTLWVRSMPPGATVSAAYGELMNHGDKTVTVASVSSDVSDSAEMHEVIAEGDQRRMAQLTSIDIAPHQTLVFEPGGRHIMLLDVAAPLAEGGKVEVCAVSVAGTRACSLGQIERQAPVTSDPHSTHH
jgi:copper(I)-binding protein